MSECVCVCVCAYVCVGRERKTHRKRGEFLKLFRVRSNCYQLLVEQLKQINMFLTIIVKIRENLLVRMMYVQFLLSVEAGVLCSKSVGAFSCLGPGHMPRICTANRERERERS